MKYDPSRHHRRSIRLQGFGYRQPACYFVTLVTHGRESIFGQIISNEVQLSTVGEIIQSAWLNIAARFPGLMLDE